MFWIGDIIVGQSIIVSPKKIEQSFVGDIINYIYGHTYKLYIYIYVCSGIPPRALEEYMEYPPVMKHSLLENPPWIVR